MKFDLLEALGPAWTGGNITADTDRFEETYANAQAASIAKNLSEGNRPDGTGSMPISRTSKRPRGQGSRTAASIKARKRGPGNWVIAADEDVPGKLGRILKGIPLVADVAEGVTEGLEALFSI